MLAIPNTVDSAFNSFLKNSVNLDPQVTKSAKSSRNWLIDQISRFDDGTNAFPSLCSEFNINFGSFERRTKKRPLDDIDLMIGLNAQGSSYLEYQGDIKITVGPEAGSLKPYRHENSEHLNSRKVTNAFVRKLRGVPQYSHATIVRNGEAATLNLTSYDWSFDIVPCFKTVADNHGKTYFLIPDGNGHWKKTDPRLDRERVSRVNQLHDGNVLNVIRALKFWNRRPTMPSMDSYLIENMILDYFEFHKMGTASSYIDLEIAGVLEHIGNHILTPVYDPKGIQGNINKLPIEDQLKVMTRALVDRNKALEARQLETDGNHEESIRKWGEIFGADFYA